MDKNTYRVLVIMLLMIIWITQSVSCAFTETMVEDTRAIKQEVKTIRDIVDGWEVEFRY